MIRFVYMPQPATFKNVGRGARSSATLPRALKRLHAELRRIGATDVEVACGFRPHQLNTLGAPYADAKPEHPDAQVSFKKGDVPMVFRCGGWDWFAGNVESIARTLEALRAIDRYGCVQEGQQYAGFASLPPGGTAKAAEWTSVEAAMRWLSGVGDGEVLSVLPSDLPAVFAAAAKRAHPDKGGSAELMAKVTRARDFIRAAAGGVT